MTTPMLDYDIKMATWNSKALLSSHFASKKLAATRMQMYSKLCKSHDIITIQETHGNMDDEPALIKAAPDHVHFLSVIPGRAAGGLALAVSKKFLEAFACYVVRELIPGRAQHLLAQGEHGSVEVVAVHLDPGQSMEDLKVVLKMIKGVMQQNMATITLLIGDLNAHPSDEPHFSIQGNIHEHRPSRFTTTIDTYFEEFAEITG